MPIVNRIADLQGEIAEWRHDLHAHPELLYDVQRTAASVAEKLKAFGCDEVVPGLGRTGVVGVIHGRKGKSDKVIGLRADMDALPIEEANDLPYKSTVPGKMHACGHDGHTAMLLGAARYLAETRNFAGTAVVIFQPAEEGGAGGKAMLDDGLMERFGIDEVYGMHNYPGMPVGQFGIRAGPMMAAADYFTIDIEGVGGHAARPHLGDRHRAGRRADHQHPAVDRVAQCRSAEVGGGVDLHVPGRQYRQRHSADRATARHRAQPDAEVRDLVGKAHARDRRGAPPAATAPRPSSPTGAIIRCSRTTPRRPISRPRSRARSSARTKSTPTLPPMMGAEDFSFMLNARPGAFILVGNGDSAGLHHPAYNFNDDVIPVGTSYWVKLVETALPG